MEKIFFIYSVQVSIGLLLFYLLYQFFFKKSTFLKIKRIYFLFVITFSLLFPCIKWIYPVKSSFLAAEYLLPVVEINETNAEVASVDILSFASEGSIVVYFFITISLIGSLLLLVRMLIQLRHIFSLKYKNVSIKNTNHSIVYVKSPDISSFSFFNWIFIPNDLKSDRQLDDILLHETVHADQKHSFDIIISEIVCILFWWNPVVWQVKKEIKLNLEYLADSEVLNQGVDPTHYQYLLLQTSNKNASIQLINNFNVSQLKKRIIMMNKEKTSGNKLFRYVLVVPIVGATMWFGSLYAESPNATFGTSDIRGEISLNAPDDQPYTMVEEMPQFPGGESAMMNYIGQNLKYPEDAIKDQVEGRVVIRFVVTKNGDVTEVETIRSLSPSCDQEALRVVKAMPQWKPGKQKGENVSVYYTLPIAYKLTKDSETK